MGKYYDEWQKEIKRLIDKYKDDKYLHSYQKYKAISIVALMNLELKKKGE